MLFYYFHSLTIQSLSSQHYDAEIFLLTASELLLKPLFCCGFYILWQEICCVTFCFNQALEASDRRFFSSLFQMNLELVEYCFIVVRCTFLT